MDQEVTGTKTIMQIILKSVYKRVLYLFKSGNHLMVCYQWATILVITAGNSRTVIKSCLLNTLICELTSADVVLVLCRFFYFKVRAPEYFRFYSVIFVAQFGEAEHPPVDNCF